MESHAVAIRDMLVLDRAGGVVLQVPEFTLPHGEVCGVYGASVEGANLFLSCVSGLCRPNEGRISIYGTALDSAALNEYAIGVVPREGGLFPDFTAQENIRLALRYSNAMALSGGDRAEREARITALLELERWMSTPAKELPGGVRQRLGLACALVHGPALLVADDPWGRADMESRDLIEHALHDHCDRGNTLLFASPREGEITSLASEICLFNRTTLVARGTLDHLRQHLDTQETIIVRVQDHAAILAKRVSSLSGVIGCTATDYSVTLQASPGSVRLTRLAEHVQALGLELLDMHVRKPDLRDIYAAVVGYEGEDGGVR